MERYNKAKMFDHFYLKKKVEQKVEKRLKKRITQTTQTKNFLSVRRSVDDLFILRVSKNFFSVFKH